MEKYVYKGKDREVILKQIYEELNVDENDIYINESEEKGGIFQGRKIVIEVVKVSEIAEMGKNLLNGILNGYSINGNIETKIRNRQISYKIHSDNNGILIGKQGRILESIKTFLKQSILAKLGINANILLDIENYKEKQNYYLERNVKKVAKDVITSKQEVKLDPMNSYERRIVHEALTKFEKIETVSEGKEPNRYVIIKYKEK